MQREYSRDTDSLRWKRFSDFAKALETRSDYLCRNNRTVTNHEGFSFLYFMICWKTILSCGSFLAVCVGTGDAMYRTVWIERECGVDRTCFSWWHYNTYKTRLFVTGFIRKWKMTKEFWPENYLNTMETSDPVLGLVGRWWRSKNIECKQGRENVWRREQKVRWKWLKDAVGKMESGCCTQVWSMDVEQYSRQKLRTRNWLRLFWMRI